MNKILNKLFYYLKNIMLPFLLIATIYIIMFMFQRLEKDIFGANLMEFVAVIAPYVILLILIVINMFLDQKSVKDSLFYNITSFLVMVTITIFCYRAIMDKNMYLWYKYGYNLNFNYFADQIATIKLMLYGLSFANIILMVKGYIKEEVEVEPEFSKEELKKEENKEEFEEEKTEKQTKRNKNKEK